LPIPGCDNLADPGRCRRIAKRLAAGEFANPQEHLLAWSIDRKDVSLDVHAWFEAMRPSEVDPDFVKPLNVVEILRPAKREKPPGAHTGWKLGRGEAVVPAVDLVDELQLVRMSLNEVRRRAASAGAVLE
jgi:hypothetical protein